MSKYLSLRAPRNAEQPRADIDPSSPGFKAGFATAVARQQEIFAHPAFPGRERQAARMLAIRDLSTAEIVDLLAAIPRDPRHDALSASEVWGRAIAANAGALQ